MRTITIDFETFYRKGKGKTPSVTSQGNWAYCHDPEWEALLISVCDGEQSWAGPIADFNWSALEDARLIAHNAAFDRCVYRRLVEDGVAPAGLLRDWRCSADMAMFTLGQRSLANAMKAGFGETVSKAARDDMSGLRLEDMKARGILPASIEYARRDAVDTYRLWEKFSPKWTTREMAASDLTITQRERGIYIDREALSKAIHSAELALFSCAANLPWIKRGAKPTSMPAVYDECRAVGIECPPTKTEDEEGYLKWEARHREQYPWVALVGHHRSISKVLASLQMLEERIRPDGRFEFDLLYFGGHTGRWSSPGFNVQNIRTTPLVVEKRTGAVVEYPEFVRRVSVSGDEESAAEYYVIDMRSLFKPAPGHVFIDCDLSQIEPRVLNWLAGDFEALEKMRSGMSIYEIFARASGRWNEPGPLKKGNPALYKLCKIQVLQLGYQSGADKFRESAFADGIVLKKTPCFDIEGQPVLNEKGEQVYDDEAVDAVQEYRKTNKKIVDLWATLEDGLFKTAGEGGDYEVALPSGRSLVYRDVRQMLVSLKTEKVGPDGVPVVRKKWQATCAIAGHFGRIPTYGGKLTENVVQATARDVFLDGMLRTESTGIRTLWPIHDQVMCEVPADNAKEACETVLRCMAQTPEWLPGCPIDAEAVIQTQYTK